MTSDGIPVLTLWQPWASLISLGVKTIETRSWSTKYRGPLAIHAAATTKGFDSLPGDCEGAIESGWRYGYIGHYQAGYCSSASDEGRYGDTFLTDLDAPTQPSDPPLGAIVATCTLVDLVPILTPADIIEQRSDKAVSVLGDSLLLCERFGAGPIVDIKDQRPYGDFAPGRFAWLLADVKPLDPPVPFKGARGLTRRWVPLAA